MFQNWLLASETGQYPDDSYCWEIQRVHTRYGWRLHRVWVCDYNY